MSCENGHGGGHNGGGEVHMTPSAVGLNRIEVYELMEKNKLGMSGAEFVVRLVLIL